jgi:hypothetical protein
VITKPTIVQRPLRHARIAGRAPRTAGYAAVVVLCLAGVSSILRGHQTINQRIVRAANTQDLAAVEFATDFARDYLSYGQSAGSQSEREQLLAPFATATLGADAGVTVNGTQQVQWAQGAQQQTSADGEEIVTVAAALTGRPDPVYLAVPVIREASGQLTVAGFPAFVGAPATDLNYQPPEETAVSDQGLTEMTTRLITNYLAGNAQNVQADLAPGAQVSLPPEPLHDVRVQATTWADASTVRVTLTASDAQQTAFSLTYLIAVTERERWYANSIEVNPTTT